jgi:hypothetical protein
MTIFQSKLCSKCNSEYIPTGPSQRFCGSCGDIQKKKVSREAVDRHRENNGVKVGIGSGGCNAKGKDDSQYKNGITYFLKHRKRIKEERRYCERCSVDLKDVAWYLWVIHHKDHDRSNNTDENFELLCKRCHQLEHDCYEHFLTVQRLSREGVGNSVSEAPSTLNG